MKDTPKIKCNLRRGIKSLMYWKEKKSWQRSNYCTRRNHKIIHETHKEDKAHP